MKRLIIIAVTTVLAMMLSVARAQDGLNIASAFGSRFRDLPESTETLLTRSNLRDVSLSLYHAITISSRPELAREIEPLVARDGAGAVSKEVRYASGRLYYGFYVLPQSGGLNRYILYLNGNLRNDDRIMLIYIEGKASVDDVRKLIGKGK